MRRSLNLDKIKKNICNLIGKDVNLRVNIGRNKYEHYNGKVLKIYDSLFTVEVNGLIKSFSYADVLTKSVLIKVNI